MDNGIPRALSDSGSSIFSGGLAGILAASVFGGPVGAAMGLGVGLLSDRLRRNELDVLTDDYSAIQKYGSSIQEQINNSRGYAQQYGDPSGSDEKQLDSIASESMRAQELSQHYDPAIRQAGLAQLTNSGNKLDAWHNDIEDRTQSLADAQYQAEIAAANHYSTNIEEGQKSLMEISSLADQAQFLVNNDHKIEHPQTKAILMQLLGMTPREADSEASTFSIGLLGTGWSTELEKFNPTYDEAIKMIESVRTTKIKGISDHLSQMIDTAQKQGFTFSADANGKIEARTINSVIQQFRSVAPNALAPGETGGEQPGVISTIKDAVSNAANANSKGGKPDMYGNLFSRGTLDAVGESPGKALDSLGGTLSVEAEKAKQWMHENIRRNRKRPTNK